MKNPTIEQLRKNGWKVFVKHKSAFHTEIFLTDTEGNTSVGVAICHDKDQPNRKLGNKIALGRAIKNYNHGFFCELPIDITKSI
jgi:hypothetical protein